MLVVTRHTVASDAAPEFQARAREALDALAACPGYLDGRIGRAVDDPAEWVLTTEWENVGSYRRALSSFGVKVGAIPLLSTAHDEPSAFEVLFTDRSADPRTAVSDRAADAGTIGLGEASSPAVPPA